MSKYRVYIESTVSAMREVEADNLEDAQDKALEEPPYAPGFADYEFGEWDISGDYYIDGEYVEGLK